MTTRDFLQFILKQAGNRSRRILALSIANGLCMGLLMYSLSIAMQAFATDGRASLRGMLLFCFSLAAYYLTQDRGGRMVADATFSALGELETRAADKLRRIDYGSFKELTPGVVYAALGGDKAAVVLASRYLIPMLSGAAVSICASIYLALISLPGIVLIAASLALVMLLRTSIHKKIMARAGDDRLAIDDFTSSLKDIVEGFTELKMNAARSDDLFSRRIAPAAAYKADRMLLTERLHAKAMVIEQATLFIPLAMTVFVLPSITPVSTEDLVRIVSVTLITIWPAYVLVQFGPAAYAANLALARLHELDSMLDKTLQSGVSDDVMEKMDLIRNFSGITCDNVDFVYPAQPGQEPFAILIRAFHLARGELVIMRGGNGSGKTTFMRMLAGLTPPTSGVLNVDGKPVLPGMYASYRELFSVIFTDFHLFNGFYGMNPDPELTEKWLKRLQLSEKVRIADGVFSTTNLSSGQRKRMALLSAILENRPILLMDEVAADFDAPFRDFFYNELLPELNAEGRTILAISHDDRYYSKMNARILTMREGMLI